jgi:predicted metal-dependent hydrolase
LKEITIANKDYIVLARKSNKAKRIIISINDESLISLIIPKYQSYKLAQKFLLSKIDWIEKSLIKIKNKQLNHKINHKIENISLTEEKIANYSQILISRCEFLIKKHNFINIGKISIRNQKTLWGSCSYNNNISLNINLTFLEQELIDYVILHELTHTKIKNHSKKFWQELDIINPNSKFFDKKLKLSRQMPFSGI